MQHGGGIMITHLDRRLISVLVAFTCTCYGPGWVLAQDVRQIERASTPSTVRLVEVLAIGALEGDADQFGRIMDVAVDGRGHLLIADDLSSQVKVFGPDGTHIASMGRPGQGPGEFVSPWAVAVDAHDSVYVWDAESGRVSVFSPGYAFVRSFRAPRCSGWVDGRPRIAEVSVTEVA